MFEQLRESLRSLSGRLAPDERRRVASTMREAMVFAKVSLQDVRDGVRATESRLVTERAELDTVRRRGGLAAQIGDEETVAIAERFAAQHAERVTMLEAKLMAQRQELTITERELDEMAVQFRLAMSGVAMNASGPDIAARREVDALLDDSFGSDALPGLDAQPNATSTPVRRTRAEREADAQDRLLALKRRMGK